MDLRFKVEAVGLVSKFAYCHNLLVRSPSLCLLARPPRFFQIEIEVYLYTTLIGSHPY